MSRRLNDPSGESDNVGETRRWGYDLQVNLHPHPPGTDSLEMLREVENRLGNMLLIAGDLTPAKDRRAVLDELSHLRCQVLLVN